MKIRNTTITKSIFYIISKLIMLIIFLPLFIVVFIASFVKVITDKENNKQNNWINEDGIPPIIKIEYKLPQIDEEDNILLN